ncbi:thioredoxin reductase [Acrasis kona]|uniref:thioredoxin-disulfide reductase (NADPH) n=1 Tax=Acrasis kona TaxID=1008807 RepID=A0AAW2Z177_9EUKA
MGAVIKPPKAVMTGPVDTHLPETGHGFDYDLIVIGGGSGGLACSKAAAELGAKVAILDFVKPSPQGTRWGLGGTCVNVGCIPKKLMHTAGIVGERLAESYHFGWNVVEEDAMNELSAKKEKFSWERLVENVQNYIHGLNFKYKVDLRSNKVEYLNALGEFLDAHTIQATDIKGNKKKMTARRFVLATGGRPVFPQEVENAEQLAISSDDLFSLDREPGKTLCVGASYVSLECAGFLTAIGNDVTVMIRSIPLRGFDEQSATMIVSHMSDHGTKILQPWAPSKLTKVGEKIQVDYYNVNTKETASDTFDTVFFAVGRYPDVKGLGLENLELKLSPSGKIQVDEFERTSVPHIYAIGDIVAGGIELTPVAIQCGKLLATRLYNSSTKKMDYINVPTTVFTPLEYGAVGLSEEAAVSKYGKDNLNIYSKSFNILEYQLPHREDQGFVKLICVKSENEKVVGFHYLGPNAGEVTQGVAIAVKLSATKQDFDDTVGIHPVCAEVFTTLRLGQTEDSGC